MIPGEIQARWKVQDKTGAKREEYSSSSFRITARPKEIVRPGLSTVVVLAGVLFASAALALLLLVVDQSVRASMERKRA
ncbi:MAG: hypothetical protein ACYDBY_14470 [Thermoanaerobaculia bacterium]